MSSQENTDDKRIHGTMLRGKQMYTAKLTESEVREMRRLYFMGIADTTQLSRMYGVNPSNAWSVVAGKTWKHVNQWEH